MYYPNSYLLPKQLKNKKQKQLKTNYSSEVKELASKFGVRYLETSTELCHNIDELLVEVTSLLRAERQKLGRQRRPSVRMVSQTPQIDIIHDFLGDG